MYVESKSNQTTLLFLPTIFNILENYKTQDFETLSISVWQFCPQSWPIQMESGILIVFFGEKIFYVLLGQLHYFVVYQSVG